jgi:hypothetical protein
MRIQNGEARKINSKITDWDSEQTFVASATSCRTSRRFLPSGFAEGTSQISSDGGRIVLSTY